MKSNVSSQVYNLVVTAGKEGISQRRLFESTSLKSNQISKVSIRLEKGGLISREKALEDGRWTFLLTAVSAINLGPYESNPCIRCPHEDRCSPGSVVTPEKCVLEAYGQGIADWVKIEYEKRKEVVSPSPKTNM